MTFEFIRENLLAENQPVTVSGKKRIQNLDALKLLSLILVLCLHCSSNYYYHNGVGSIWSMTRFVYCMGVVAIPMFFTVSGYQLLGRADSGYGYVFRKIFKILRASFLLYLIALLFQWILFGKGIYWKGIPYQFGLNLMQRGDYGLFWFVGGLSLVYLAYPVVNRIYSNKTMFLWLSAALFALMSLVFFFSVVRPVGIINEGEVYQTFRLWNWIGYFCIVGLIKRYKVFGLFGRLPVIIVLAGVCFVLLSLIALKRGTMACEYGYASLPVVMFVISVFTYFMKRKIENRFLVEMALVFMPAYALGPVFEKLVENYAYAFPEMIGAIAFVFMNAVLSVSAGWVLMKIPGVNSLLRL